MTAEQERDRLMVAWSYSNRVAWCSRLDEDRRVRLVALEDEEKSA